MNQKSSRIPKPIAVRITDVLYRDRVALEFPKDRGRNAKTPEYRFPRPPCGLRLTNGNPSFLNFQNHLETF